MSYPGSKGQAGTFQRIIGNMRPHSLYVECFFGSGQVFWRKLPSAGSVIIDRRADLLVRAGAVTGVRAICGDAISEVPKLALGPEAVLYADPPYPLSTRKGRKYYDHEMSDDQHASLLAMLQVLKCNVLISSYPNELYSSQLQSWRCVPYQTRTRGRTLTECLWCNFPEPETLHDWRYAGRNYRERLYLRRLAARWLARLEGMPERKRGYLLSAIAQRQKEQFGIPAPELALGSVELSGS